MLTLGLRVGAFEITGSLGIGGMGEVYRARDSRLGRDVALKVLPHHFAADPERLARFEREAQMLAALNHPNIAAIHGLEDAGGMRALVLELVEGETLEQRIARGPVPLDEALPLIRQLMDALDAAHERGIVHRDLKPANIKIAPGGTLKVLDFGLAKLADVAGETGTSATITSPAMLTQAGMLLGTAAYMSPEQARGKPADKRADIWAFGCVVFELVTGARAFEGETISDAISSVLTRTPDWTRVPAALRPLVRVCLERDARRRLRDLGDAARMLEQRDASAPSAGWRAWLPWAALLGTVLASAVLVGWMRAPYAPVAPAASPSLKMALDLGGDASNGDFPATALSRDGSRIAFVIRGGDGIGRLLTRRLDEADARALPGTERATMPLFSPDGEWVAFFAGGKLKKVRVDGRGEPFSLCSAPAGRGATWLEDGRIIAALDNRAPLSVVSSSGGEVTALTELAAGELTHRFPQALPGGRAVVFIVGNVPGNYASAAIAVASTDASGGRTKKIVGSGMAPRYVRTGHLLYVRNGSLMAAPFDLATLAVTGAASPVLEDVSTSVGFGSAQLEMSDAGVLLYRSGQTPGQTIVQWLDPSGRTDALWPEPSFYQFPHVSPTDERILASIVEGGTQHIEVYDWRRASRSRLTNGSGVNSYPIWSPDGQFVVFQADGGIKWTRSNGADSAKPLIPHLGLQQFPASFSPDGRTFLFVEVNPGGSAAIKSVPIAVRDTELRASGEPRVYHELSSTSSAATFSPDGRWIAYASNESGDYEVYVRAFPDNGSQWMVSSSGGNFPMWSAKGRKLFYRTDDQLIMAVDYTVSGAAFTHENPRTWSPTRLFNTGLVQNFDVAADGRIAVLMTAQKPAVQRIVLTVIPNFFDEILRRMRARAGG